MHEFDKIRTQEKILLPSCLIKELWGDKIHKNEEDNLDDPENSYYFYVEETTDENTFLNNLKNLIKDANDDGKI